MQIWIDGDACPRQIKDISIRAAIRTQTHLNFVSNHFVPLTRHALIHRVNVAKGFDRADNYIISKLNKGDLVITADIPLADGAIGAGARALNPRGHLYTQANIKQVLAFRNFNTAMRDAGLLAEGQGSPSAKDSQAFANQLDRLLRNA